MDGLTLLLLPRRGEAAVPEQAVTSWAGRARPRLILLADSDAESSSAGSSDEDDATGAEPAGAPGERLPPPGTEGYGGAGGLCVPRGARRGDGGTLCCVSTGARGWCPWQDTHSTSWQLPKGTLSSVPLCAMAEGWGTPKPSRAELGRPLL